MLVKIRWNKISLKPLLTATARNIYSWLSFGPSRFVMNAIKYLFSTFLVICCCSRRFVMTEKKKGIFFHRFQRQFSTRLIKPQQKLTICGQCSGTIYSKRHMNNASINTLEKYLMPSGEWKCGTGINENSFQILLNCIL